MKCKYSCKCGFLRYDTANTLVKASLLSLAQHLHCMYAALHHENVVLEDKEEYIFY